MKKLIIVVLTCLFLGSGFAQEKAKDSKARSYTFHGKVEAVTAKV